MNIIMFPTIVGSVRPLKILKIENIFKIVYKHQIWIIQFEIYKFNFQAVFGLLMLLITR